MIVFILLILSCCLLSVLNVLFGTVNKGTGVTNNSAYVIIVSILLIAIAGLRDPSVGIDTLTYLNHFYEINSYELSEVLYGIDREQGYILFVHFIGQVFGEFQVFLFSVAIIYIFVVSYYIYNFSRIPVLSYVLFIGFGFYTFGMSAIRQTIAISLIMIAYRYAMQKRLLMFLLFEGVASMFHITALIFLPSFWFNRLEFNKKSLAWVIVIAVIVAMTKEDIISILNSFATIAYTESETGGKLMYIFMLFNILLGILYRKRFIAKNTNNKFFLYMMIAAAIIMPLTQFHPAMMRLYYYYFIFLIIYIPNLLNAIDNHTIRYFGIIGYMAISIFYFFADIIYTSELEKYSFFWK